MAYDLLIRNGLVVDGSGMPAFRGDIAVTGGKIAELGKLSGPAENVIDAGGQAVAPGFIDNHCHYDAQVTWDPLCTFSPEHGATTVIFGNCSLALAPVKPGTEKRVAEFLSYVEAIPVEVLDTVEFDWETIPQYMEKLDRRLGVNVGTLIGHSAVRYYVMGEDCQKRAATEAELKAMQAVVRDGMEAGALGLSVSRNRGHYDPQGVHIPALWADEKEIFGLGDVLRELGTGVIQSGGGRAAEMKDALMSRLSEATGRTVVYNNLGQTVREPDLWKKHMARLEETARAGIRAYPLCSPNRVTQSFTMKNCQVFRGAPTWHPILLASDAEKLRAYSDPAIRQKLHEEVVEHTVTVPAAGYSRSWWDYMWVEEPALEKNKSLKGKTIGQIAKLQNKRVIDAFLDLVVEERLETLFMQAENNVDDAAMAKILTCPNAIVGLSDGGAHVQFHGGYGYSTRLLSEWVREKRVMSLEQAVRRLTFDSASAFGLYDRGLLRPGMAADIVIFDPETVRPLPESIVHDFPAGGWRVKEPAAGIAATIVNGEVLLEDGRHTGALPGRVLRNSRYQTNGAA
jgi:N-acyl-D-aspartate/D-glutamate deacylase